MAVEDRLDFIEKEMYGEDFFTKRVWLSLTAMLIILSTANESRSKSPRYRRRVTIRGERYVARIFFSRAFPGPWLTSINQIIQLQSQLQQPQPGGAPVAA